MRKKKKEKNFFTYIGLQACFLFWLCCWLASVLPWVLLPAGCYSKHVLHTPNWAGSDSSIGLLLCKYFALLVFVILLTVFFMGDICNLSKVQLILSRIMPLVLYLDSRKSFKISPVVSGSCVFCVETYGILSSSFEKYDHLDCVACECLVARHHLLKSVSVLHCLCSGCLWVCPPVPCCCHTALGGDQPPRGHTIGKPGLLPSEPLGVSRFPAVWRPCAPPPPCWMVTDLTLCSGPVRTRRHCRV